MRTENKQRLAKRRHQRVRCKVSGTSDRPRMSVCFTGRNVYVQFIDDVARVTLAATSSLAASAEAAGVKSANIKSAVVLGRLAAEAAQQKGITTVVFDRGASSYHGKVKALADAAREAGLKF